MAPPFEQPDFTSQLGSTYKRNIDDAIANFSRVGNAFHVEATDPPSMDIKVNAGQVFFNGALTEIAEQTFSPVPLGGLPDTNNEWVRIVIDPDDGDLTLLSGTEAVDPEPPFIGDNLPCARILLSPGMTEITNDDIYDERIALPNGSSYYSTVVWMTGDFAESPAQSLYLTKVGEMFMLTAPGLRTHPSASTAATSNDIPSWMRPSTNLKQVVHMDDDGIQMVTIQSNGVIAVEYRDWSGTLRADTQMFPFTMCWTQLSSEWVEATQDLL